MYTFKDAANLLNRKIDEFVAKLDMFTQNVDHISDSIKMAQEKIVNFNAMFLLFINVLIERILKKKNKLFNVQKSNLFN